MGIGDEVAGCAGASFVIAPGLCVPFFAPDCEPACPNALPAAPTQQDANRSHAATLFRKLGPLFLARSAAAATARFGGGPQTRSPIGKLLFIAWPSLPRSYCPGRQAGSPSCPRPSTRRSTPGNCYNR